MLKDLASSVPGGPARGEVLWCLGRMRHESNDFSPECIGLFEDALGDVGSEESLRARILNGLAWAHLFLDLDRAVAHALQASKAALAAGDFGMLADALTSVGFFELLRGGSGQAALERAVALEPYIKDVYIDERPSWFWSVALMICDRFDEARELYRGFIDEAKELGEDGSLGTIRYHLGLLESMAGNWETAADVAEEGRAEAVQSDQPVAAARLLYVTAQVNALQGRLEVARRQARESLNDLEAHKQPAVLTARPRSVLGFIALSEGDPVAAVEELAPLQDALRRAGVREPGAARLGPDLAEAYIQCGKLDEAEEVIAVLEKQGRRLDRAFALATGARCRGMLLAARGNTDGALDALHTALVEHKRLPQPFERGRTLLALGQVQRRSKLKKAARDSLGRALAIFEELGAAVWAEHARAELGRIGGRAPGVAALTPTEERVAALATEGLTNQEIAQRMFVTVRTVEWNLSKVYRKLHIRSRTELARAGPR